MVKRPTFAAWITKKENRTARDLATAWVNMRANGETDYSARHTMAMLVRDHSCPFTATDNLIRARDTGVLGDKTSPAARARLARPETDQDLLATERSKSERRDRVRELNRAVRALEAELAASNIRADLFEQLAEVPDMPISIKPHSNQGKGRPAATYCMAASDWHMGERVRPETVGNRNEYNPDIAQERAYHFWRSNLTMLKAARSAWDIRDGLLWLGGDLITGYIHEEYEEDNFLSPTEESLLVYKTVRDGINFLLKESDLDRFIIPTSHGNHGRTNKKPRIGTSAKNSYEWMVYQMLAMHFEDEPRIQFQIASGYHNIVDLYGVRIRFHHGDEIGYGGGVGGISVPVNRRITRQAQGDPEPIALDVLGHFHSLQHPKAVIVNGSLIGWTPFAEAKGFGFEEPMQASFVVDDRFKLVSNFNPILVKR